MRLAIKGTVFTKYWLGKDTFLDTHIKNSSNLSKIGVIFNSFTICTFVLWSVPSVSCCSSHVFHLCCCYSSGVTCFNRMPRNRLPRVMKYYSPTGTRNHGRSLKRLLDTWDQNGSTSGPTPWKIHGGGGGGGDDDDDDDDDTLKINSVHSVMNTQLMKLAGVILW